jgi:hypothetical protein
MENFNKGDLVRWPASRGLPDVIPSRETKIGILIKKVDKHEEKSIIYMIVGLCYPAKKSTSLPNRCLKN